MEQELRQRIELLELENRRLREREIDANRTLSTLIKKLPMAALAVDHNLKLLYSNDLLMDLLDYQARQVAQILPSMEGVALESIVSREFYTLVSNSHLTGQDSDRVYFPYEGTIYAVSVYSIRRGELTIALVRGLNDPQLNTEEAVACLRETISRNMSMIQQVALLLGEEVSENAKVLGSVIQTLQSKGRVSDQPALNATPEATVTSAGEGSKNGVVR